MDRFNVLFGKKILPYTVIVMLVMLTFTGIFFNYGVNVKGQTVVTANATNIGNTFARLNGELTDMGGYGSVNVSFQYMKTDDIYYTFDNTAKKFGTVPEAADQGVATDGTYIFTSDNPILYMFDMDGNNLDDYTHGVADYKAEDFTVVDGIVFATLSNHNNIPKHGKILLFYASNFTYIKTIDLDENIHPATLAYKDDLFYMSYTQFSQPPGTQCSIYVYNYTFGESGFEGDAFNFVESKTFPVIGSQDNDYASYSGMEWIGNYLYGNKHTGSSREIDVVHLEDDGTWTAYATANRVQSGAYQGMTYDSVNHMVYWANAGEDGEVWESDLVPNYNWTNTTEETMHSTGSFDKDITGLDDNTNYSFRTAIEYDGDTEYGEVMFFITGSTCSIPFFVSINGLSNSSLANDVFYLFNWSNNSISGRDYYQLQVANDTGFTDVFIDLNVNESSYGVNYSEIGSYVEFTLPSIYRKSWYGSYYFRVRKVEYFSG